MTISDERGPIPGQPVRLGAKDRPIPRISVGFVHRPTDIVALRSRDVRYGRHPHNAPARLSPRLAQEGLVAEGGFEPPTKGL